MKMEKRIVLDYIMLLVLLALMLKPLTGVIAHEILGVGFVILIVIHYANNRGWIKKARKKPGMLVINSLLIVSVILTALGGVMVSVVLFGFLNIPYHEIYYKIHTSAAQAVLLLSLCHLLMHMKMIGAFVRKKQVD